MSMSKKDYEAMAATLKQGLDYRKSITPRGERMESHIAGYTDAIVQLACVLGKENPRFDRGRFLTACGVHS